MSAIMCQYVRAVSDAYHMYEKVNIMSVFIHEHEKAARDDHHMYGRLNTMLAIVGNTFHHREDVGKCW